MSPLEPEAYRDLVRRALAEDVGAGDITTSAVVPDDVRARAWILARAHGVIAGLPVATAVFHAVDPSLVVRTQAADADRCAPGDRVLGVDGSAASILTAERTALNFLQHLSGIATAARTFVDAAAGRITVLDTRKTTPGLRALEKYAVRCGGATNHRAGLYDAILIKDNHILIAGGIAEAIRRARAHRPDVTLEVEAESIAQAEEAAAAGADIIMLDNMDPDAMTEAFGRISGRAKVEISGGVTLERLPALAAVGADYLSVGSMTHSAPSLDFSLELESADQSAAH